MSFLERKIAAQKAALVEKPVVLQKTQSDGPKRPGRPRGTTKARKPIMPEDFDRLLEYIDTDESLSKKMKEKWTRVAALCFYTGVRIGEILLLTVGDLRMAVKQGEASLTNNTKTRRPRLLIFTGNAIEILKHLFEEYLDPELYDYYTSDQLLFHAPRHPTKALNKAGFTREFNAVIEAALGKLYTSHSFRAGILTSLAQARISPKIAQIIAGHQNAQITLSYYKPTEFDVRSAISEVR